MSDETHYGRGRFVTEATTHCVRFVPEATLERVDAAACKMGDRRQWICHSTTVWADIPRADGGFQAEFVADCCRDREAETPHPVDVATAAFIAEADPVTVRDIIENLRQERLLRREYWERWQRLRGWLSDADGILARRMTVDGDAVLLRRLLARMDELEAGK